MNKKVFSFSFVSVLPLPVPTLTTKTEEQLQSLVTSVAELVKF